MRSVISCSLMRKEVCMLAMIQSSSASSSPHLVDRVVPVRGHGVAVQIAADVSQLDQSRQAPRARRLELAAVLAELGLDVGQAEELIDLLLGGAAVGDARLVVEHPILRDVQAAAHGGVAQGGIVLARAREVLKQIAELLRRADPQIDRDAGVRAPPGARLAGRADALDLPELGEAARELSRVTGGCHKIQVL